MSKVEAGSRVEIHLVGRLNDKSVFVTTYDGDPLELEVGDGSLIAPVEDAMLGMTPGEKRAVSVEPAKAYGPRDEGLVFQIEKSQVEAGIEIGDEVILKTMDEDIPFRVTSIGDKVTIDGNHPLAGKAVHFEIEVVRFLENPPTA